MNKRHNHNRERIANRLIREIEKRENELMKTRQSWDEWEYLQNMKANLFRQERG